MKKLITKIKKLFKMADKLFRVCGDKKIEIQKVPCCPKISRGLFFTGNPEESYVNYFNIAVGQPSCSAGQFATLTTDKIAGVVAKNTTPHYVKMLCTKPYPNSSNVPAPEVFNFTLPPFGDASQSYPQPVVLQSYNGSIGFVAQFFSDAECTQPVALESGLVELVFIAFDGCSPCTGSGSGAFGIGGVLIENLANAK